MLNYFLQTSLIWGASLLFYHLMLRRETFFFPNRWYLLFTALAGLSIPLIDFSILIKTSSELSVWLPEIFIGVDGLEKTIVHSSQSGFDWHLFFITLYLIGFCFSGIRFTWGLLLIFRLKKNGTIQRKEGYYLVKTNIRHAPFSFFKWLFINRDVRDDSFDTNQIILHEQAHIIQKHSYDVIFLELITLFFWWNPLVYIYKNYLQEVHEYLADQHVLLLHQNKKQYGHLLIKQSESASVLVPKPAQIALANHFFHSQLKNRILMINKQPSGKWMQVKFLFALPFLALIVFACQQTIQEENMEPQISEQGSPINGEASSDKIPTAEFLYDTIYTFDPATLKENMEIVQTEIFNVVEEMPHFPGCEDLADKSAIKACADQKMLEFIYKNVKYPAEAKDAGIQGTVVVSFVVTAYDGGIQNVNVVRGIGGGCDEEVLRVIRSMPPWIPGRQKGKNVNVKFNLPVRFALN